MELLKRALFAKASFIIGNSRFIAYIVILPFLLTCQMSVLSTAVASSDTDDFLEAADALCDAQSIQSKQWDKWYRFYSEGKLAQADNVWSSMLKENAKKPSIAKLLENINQRCWFEPDRRAGAPPRDRIDPRKAYEHILASTEKQLGKDHRFVGDVCKFVSLYAESAGDYKAAKLYRLREVNLHRKWLGEENNATLLSMSRLGHLLVKMKDYAEAEKVLKHLIALSFKNPTGSRFRQATLDYIDLLNKTGRNAEAQSVLSKYKIYLYKR